MSLLALPQDIIIEILSLFDSSRDGSALKALALTCSSFCVPCQQRLFRHLVVPNLDRHYNQKKTASMLYELLEASPRFSGYFKVVVYSWHPRDIKEPCIARILQRLNNVETIEALRMDNMDWGLLSPLWSSSISYFIQGPTVRHLKLESIKNFPISHLLRLQNTLISLRCVNMEFKLPGHKATLLKDGRMKKLFRRLLFLSHDPPSPPIISFNQIKEFSITWRGMEASRTARLLDFMPVLETLHCSTTGSTTSEFVGFSRAVLEKVGMLPNIRTLSIRVPFFAQNRNAFGQLCQEIEQTSTIPYVGTLALDLVWDAFSKIQEIQKNVELLDTLLTRDRFPHLKVLKLSVSLRLLSDVPELPSEQTLVDMCNMCLPKVAENMDIEVQCKSKQDISYWDYEDY